MLGPVQEYDEEGGDLVSTRLSAEEKRDVRRFYSTPYWIPEVTTVEAVKDGLDELTEDDDIYNFG